MKHKITTVLTTVLLLLSFLMYLSTRDLIDERKILKKYIINEKIDSLSAIYGDRIGDEFDLLIIYMVDNSICGLYLNEIFSYSSWFESNENIKSKQYIFLKESSSALVERYGGMLDFDIGVIGNTGKMTYLYDELIDRSGFGVGVYIIDLEKQKLNTFLMLKSAGIISYDEITRQFPEY